MINRRRRYGDPTNEFNQTRPLALLDQMSTSSSSAPSATEAPVTQNGRVTSSITTSLGTVYSPGHRVTKTKEVSAVRAHFEEVRQAADRAAADSRQKEKERRNLQSGNHLVRSQTQGFLAMQDLSEQVLQMRKQIDSDRMAMAALHAEAHILQLWAVSLARLNGVPYTQYLSDASKAKSATEVGSPSLIAQSLRETRILTETVTRDMFEVAQVQASARSQLGQLSEALRQPLYEDADLLALASHDERAARDQFTDGLTQFLASLPSPAESEQSG